MKKKIGFLYINYFRGNLRKSVLEGIEYHRKLRIYMQDACKTQYSFEHDFLEIKLQVCAA